LLALVGALGVGRLSEIGVPIWAVLGVWALVGLWQGASPGYVTRVHEPDWYFPWSDIFRIVNTRSTNSDQIIVQLPRLTGHFAHEPLVEHYSEVSSANVLDYPFYMTQLDYRQHIENKINKETRLWTAHKRDLIDNINFQVFQETLSEIGFIRCESYIDTPELRLDLHAYLPNNPEIQFEGVEVSSITSTMDQTHRINITMGWQNNPDFNSGAYSYSLQVTDENETIIRQFDEGIPTSEQACTTHDFDTYDLADGTYTVNLVVYAWQTNERLSTDGRDIIPLAMFDRN
ncbi:MAG: hypothetical protein AAF125_19510, partial [Chloroflexota bacterium]